MKKKKKIAAEWLDNHQDQIVKMAKIIWEKPELPLDEYFASKTQMDYLKELDL